MPYCTNCGEEVTEEQRYCSYCGERLGTDTSRGGPSGTPGAEPGDHGGPGAPDGVPPVEGDHPADREKARQPVARRREEPGARKRFVAGLKGITSSPLALVGLFVAWFAVSVTILFSPGLALAVFAGGAILGLVSVGILYVETDAAEDGTTNSTGAALGTVGTRLGSLVALLILTVPLVVLGLFAFLLPGLYVAGRLLLAFPATVLDGEGPLASLSTSWHLTSGRSLTTFGMVVLSGLAFLVLVIVLTIPQSITFTLVGIELPAFDPATDSIDDVMAAADTAYVVGSSVFQSIALAIATGALQVAAATMYLDLRDEEETKDEWRYY